MTPKEKSYAKMTLTNRISQLQENSDSASEENTKNFYYAPNIKALQTAVNIINVMPDEDSIDVVVTLLNNINSSLDNPEISNKILSVIDYLLASL
jgi:hypothetical protein